MVSELCSYVMELISIYSTVSGHLHSQIPARYLWKFHICVSLENTQMFFFFA